MPPTFPTSEAAAQKGSYELPDCFDFVAAREFLRKMKSIPESKLPGTLRIDLCRTRYMDTAGLGCLLLIGEHLGASRTIRIEGANAEIRSMLAIARIEERLATRAANQPDLRSCVNCTRRAHDRCNGTLAESAACRRIQPREVKSGTGVMPTEALLTRAT